jgi:hypothetical protein
MLSVQTDLLRELAHADAGEQPRMLDARADLQTVRSVRRASPRCSDGRLVWLRDGLLALAGRALASAPAILFFRFRHEPCPEP